MSKNSNTGMMRRSAMAIVALGSLLSPGMGKATAHQLKNNDAIVQNVSNKHKREKLPFVSGRSSYMPSYKRGDLNQRQYRKKCRQNPSLYKSKKHRSKN